MDTAPDRAALIEAALLHWTSAIVEGHLPPNVLVWVWWLPIWQDECGRCGTVMSVVGGPN